MAPDHERPPEPRLTLDEVDEALGWAVARTDRDEQWHTWVNDLLDKRLEVARGNR